MDDQTEVVSWGCVIIVGGLPSHRIIAEMRLLDVVMAETIPAGVLVLQPNHSLPKFTINELITPYQPPRQLRNDRHYLKRKKGRS